MTIKETAKKIAEKVDKYANISYAEGKKIASAAARKAKAAARSAMQFEERMRWREPEGTKPKQDTGSIIATIGAAAVVGALFYYEFVYKKKKKDEGDGDGDGNQYAAVITGIRVDKPSVNRGEQIGVIGKFKNNAPNSYTYGISTGIYDVQKSAWWFSDQPTGFVPKQITLAAGEEKEYQFDLVTVPDDATVGSGYKVGCNIWNRPYDPTKPWTEENRLQYKEVEGILTIGGGAIVAITAFGISAP